MTGSIAAYKAVELAPAPARRGRRRVGDADAVGGAASSGRCRSPRCRATRSRPTSSTCCPTGGSATSSSPTRPTPSSWRRRPRTGWRAMAGGLSGDVVTATCLATSAPVVVAPAMDGDMWTHPATVANVARLRSFGYAIVEPGSRSARVGPVRRRTAGRARRRSSMRSSRPSAIARSVPPDPAARPPLAGPARDADLAGRHIVVTAGGTREAIDPVRFIGNRSTGRMGVAIAEAALDRGARVTIIAANIEVPLPPAADGRPRRVDGRPARRAAAGDARHRRRRRVRRPGHGGRGRRLPARRGRRDASCRARSR